MAVCGFTGARLAGRGLSALAGVVAATGRQWLALNLETQNRSMLALLQSSATGLQEFSSPCLLQSREGYSHLVYTWRRSRIKHVWLDSRQVLQPDATRHASCAAH